MSTPERDQARELLVELSNAPGAPAHEGSVRTIVHRHLEAGGGHAFATDGNGSLACTRPGDPADGPRVMVTAHMDEVAFLLQNITPEGFLQFVTLGGWWTHCLLAQKVHVITRAGEAIPGVVGSVPPHFLPAEARRQVLPVEKLFIDVGATDADEARSWGIQLGDPIVPAVTAGPMRHPDLLLGKAFDNRVGVSLLVQTMLDLEGEPLPSRLSGVATVQEELGLRGARTAARLARPDVAIVLEGPPADDTPGFVPAEAQGVLGKGVQIRLMDPTAVMNRELVDLVRTVARRESIPHQETVRRGGGTDAGAIHLEEQGIPCIVLGVPCRYIHSHHSILHLDDYLAALTLVKALVRELDGEAVAGLTRYL